MELLRPFPVPPRPSPAATGARTPAGAGSMTLSAAPGSVSLPALRPRGQRRLKNAQCGSATPAGRETGAEERRAGDREGRPRAPARVPQELTQGTVLLTPQRGLLRAPCLRCGPQAEEPDCSLRLRLAAHPGCAASLPLAAPFLSPAPARPVTRRSQSSQSCAALPSAATEAEDPWPTGHAGQLVQEPGQPAAPLGQPAMPLGQPGSPLGSGGGQAGTPIGRPECAPASAPDSGSATDPWEEGFAAAAREVRASLLSAPLPASCLDQHYPVMEKVLASYYELLFLPPEVPKGPCALFRHWRVIRRE